MDYQKEYLEKNPNMHLEDSLLKLKQIEQVIPQNLKLQRVLDVACGAGLITIKFAEKYKPGHTVGVDISGVMINKAKELDAKKAVEWKVADFFKLRTNKKYDLVMCVDILEHIEDDRAFMEKAKELGKHVLVKTPLEKSLLSKILVKLGIFDPWKDTEKRYGHVHHYDEKELNELFKKSGLKVVKSLSVPMPRRSKLVWEFFRLLFYPIALFSVKRMVETSGGFKIVLLKA